jgi:NTE family protein
LIRRNSEQQRATLTERDILITPALGSASSFDFQNVRKAIEQGEQAGRDLLPRLIALAVSPNEYARRVATRTAARQVPTRVDFVRTDLASERYRETLQAYFGEFAEQPLNAPELDARLTSLYGRGDFESLDYLWVRDGARQGLEMRARRNSYGPNYIRFGLNLEDDFRGNSNFTAAARFVMTELSRRGAEWTWDLQVGERPVIATEYYWPLDQRQRWFLTPRARFSVRNVPLRVDDDVVAQFRLRDFSYGIDVGREFGEWGELRVGVQWAEGRSRLRVGDPQLAAERFDVRQWFMRFSVDQLDDVNFPRSGQSLTAEVRSETSRLAGVDAADFVTFDGLIARSSGRNTGVLWLSGGSTLDATQSDPRNLFTLGGFLNLSGVSPDSISGRHYAIARGLYYRQIGRAGAGFLNVPTYLGVSYEAGNVWDRRRDISFSDARQNGSLFLGLDTLLGPVYLGAGWNDAGNSAFYLFLGRTF